MPAGVRCVVVDGLKRRDAQRRAWIRSMVTTGLLMITTVTIGLAIVAYLSRQESELRRGQAEHLISFMLGDLRNKLEPLGKLDLRSEEHTSELQSLMRISYAVFCLKKKKHK